METKILVVDDEEILLTLYKDSIESLAPEWAVKVKASFKEGQQYGLDHMSELQAVLLDANMPGGHGWEIAELLRSADYKGIILCIAGQSFSDSVPIGKRWLFNGFFHKPAKMAEVVQFLKEWMF